MKNWTKALVCMVLSFSFLFIAVGYAALSDTLTISGSANASPPETIYITDIEYVSGTNLGAAIVYPTNMSATITAASGATAVYEITVLNNSTSTYVYTGTDVADVYAEQWGNITAESTDSNNETIPGEITDYYVSGTPIAPGEEFTFLTTYNFKNDFEATEILINYGFQEVDYTITYINNQIELDIRCVTDNSVAVSTENDKAQEKAMADMGEGYEFSHWMNAGSTKIETISADNTEDVILYPAFEGIYTAIFVDQEGNVLDWTTFTTSDYSSVTAMADYLHINGKIPETDELSFDYWNVHVTDADGNTIEKTALSQYTFGQTDITLYPVYTYNGDVNLIPVDEDGDGDTDYYEVIGIDKTDDDAQDNVKIPSDVNGVPVIAINDDSFSGFSNLTDVYIPVTVTEIGENAFADKQSASSGIGYKYETVQIFYEGTKKQWDAITKPMATRENVGSSWWPEYEYTNGWDTYLGEGSVIVCSDGYYVLEGSNKRYDKNWVWYYGEYERDFGE